jgi:hypothetical protein
MIPYSDLPVGVTLIDDRFADLLIRKEGNTFTFLNLLTGVVFTYTADDVSTVDSLTIHYPCRSAP